MAVLLLACSFKLWPLLSGVQAESDYTRALMADTEALQEKLFGEMKGRMLESSTVVPIRLAGRWVV